MGDDTPVIEAVLACDAERTALLKVRARRAYAEIKRVEAQLKGGIA